MSTTTYNAIGKEIEIGITSLIDVPERISFDTTDGIAEIDASKGSAAELAADLYAQCDETDRKAFFDRLASRNLSNSEMEDTCRYAIETRNALRDAPAWYTEAVSA